MFVQFAIGLICFVRGIILRDPSAPQVQEASTEVPLIQSHLESFEELSVNNPKLTSLYERYRSDTPFEAITAPFWHCIPERLDLKTFRSHGPYLWTNESKVRYQFTAFHIAGFDKLNLLRTFGEDHAFGCETFSFRGMTLSRDKLDSIMEIYYLIMQLGIKPFDHLKVLEIGAGYGRLAHRFTSLFQRSNFYCVDAIPSSTFISEYYLNFRKAHNAHVVPFDDLQSLSHQTFDFAISVHSFPEQTRASINLWLDLLDNLAIKTLVLIDHNGQWLTMEPPAAIRAR